MTHDAFADGKAALGGLVFQPLPCAYYSTSISCFESYHLARSSP
jgi:hypothetical protein